MLCRPLLASLVLALLLPTAAAAQTPAERAAFLFAYTPHEGQQAQFDEGYRQHLAWHREHADPLVWYGWYVLSGPRTGMFVDGTFGAPFAAIDERVDPAGDRADFARTTAPYGRIELRTAYLLRDDLGTATPLEDLRPPPTQQVLRYEVRPGMAAAFEAAVARLASALGSGVGPGWTVYEAVDGDALPLYLVVVPRRGFGAYAAERGDLLALARRHLAGDGDLLDRLGASIASVDSETWLYREDLSYLPE